MAQSPRAKAKPKPDAKPKGTETRRAGTTGAVPTSRLSAPGSRLPGRMAVRVSSIGVVAAYRPRSLWAIAGLRGAPGEERRAAETLLSYTTLGDTIDHWQGKLGHAVVVGAVEQRSRASSCTLPQRFRAATQPHCEGSTGP